MTRAGTPTDQRRPVRDADADRSAVGGISAAKQQRLYQCVSRFVSWLDRHGEVSLDFQSIYAGKYGQWAKSRYYRSRRTGTLAVAPLVLCEAVFPTARRFCYHPQRFPIGDAHYAMAFAKRYECAGNETDLCRAVHFLEALVASAVVGKHGIGWGYPFNWVTIDGVIPTGTSLITTLPYVYEAFRAVYVLTGEPKWREVLVLIAQHALYDYKSRDCGSLGKCSPYTPSLNDSGLVVNASAYRGFLLSQAAVDLGGSDYLAAAEENLEFVRRAQNPDGSWFYAMDGRRDFVDHFHTCFVLKSLLKAEQAIGSGVSNDAISRGLDFYLEHLFDHKDLPRPFARPPRLIVYRRELYDYAEAINLLTLAATWDERASVRRERVIDDVLERWQQGAGCFRTRQLWLGWDNVPMHRWGQSQLLRSLCGVLLEGATASRKGVQREPPMRPAGHHTA